MKDTLTTPRDRVLAALGGGRSDRVPFTAYENKIPQCTAERGLRNRGLCIVYRMPSYRAVMPNVKITSLSFTDGSGRNLIRRNYETPGGTLTELVEPAGFTNWTREYLFKSPADYKPLLSLIRDTAYVPDYAAAARKIEDLGPDFIVRDQIPAEPLQQLISNYMGTETFCYEWMDSRDEILRLYDAIVEANRKVYPIVAGGPMRFANYGGNVTPSVIGAGTFRRYYAPNYDEAAEVLHAGGKRIGTHLDADNTAIMADVAATRLDYVEAFDPGLGPSVKAARQAWPGKVLWINWPSAWHLEPVESVREKTKRLIGEAGACEGFLIGVTEDVPAERWRGNFAAIMDGIDDCPIR